MKKHVAGFVAVLVGALLAGLNGCGGGGTGGAQSERPPTFVLNAAGTSSDSGTLVVGIDRNSIDANNSDTVGVVATLRDPLGDPIAGIPITFEASFLDVSFEGGAAPDSMHQFPYVVASSSEAGTATAVIRAGSTSGRLAIQAEAPKNFNLGGLIFLTVNNVGFISGDLQILPAEISVIDPAAGTQLEFSAIGGQPFKEPSPPYLLRNASSILGSAQLVSGQIFPTAVRYTLTGKLDGILQGTHVFSLVDAAGSSVSATVNVTFTEFKIVPSSATLVDDQTQILALSGGIAPYSCVTTGGRVDPSIVSRNGETTTFTPDPVIEQTSLSVSCTDQSGQVATASIVVSPTPLEIAPSSATLDVGQSQVFALTGGLAPYSCSSSGGGTLLPAVVETRGGTTTFTPDLVAGQTSFSIVCRDKAGQTIAASVTVVPTPLSISPSAATLDIGQAQVFALTGGLAPYECSSSGGGVLSPSVVEIPGGTTTFTPDAVASETSFSIVCRDKAGQTVAASVTVAPAQLSISPPSVNLVPQQSQVFAVTGGLPPYSCTASGGHLEPSTISSKGGTTTFTADDTVIQTTYSILCTDVGGQVASATVTIALLPSPSSGGSATPAPSATPRVASAVVVRSNPPSINGVAGGQSTVSATVLDRDLEPIAGINVLFSLAGQMGTPTAQVPSLSDLTVRTDSSGAASTVLTVPPGTPPQFLTITADAGSASGSGQVGVTSQSTQPPGQPARLTAAPFKVGAFGDNNDGTYVTILSALVTDSNGNPVADGVEVDWGPVQPTSATVASPSFTNGQPPCNTTPYTANTGLAINPQPGTALTCLIYPATIADLAGNVRVNVAGTTLTATANVGFPGPVRPSPTPRPTSEPPTNTPAPTPTLGPPMVVPSTASLMIGQSQVFAITKGVPPYSVNGSGGTVVPMTVFSEGGTFTYTKTQAGTFTVVVVDANGQVATAAVTEPMAPTPTP